MNHHYCNTPMKEHSKRIIRANGTTLVDANCHKCNITVHVERESTEEEKQWREKRIDLICRSIGV